VWIIDIDIDSSILVYSRRVAAIVTMLDWVRTAVAASLLL
jgi:hypothetical protein